MERVTGSSSIYPEISARCRGVKQLLYQIKQELNSTRKSSDIELRINCNAAVHGTLEPFIEKASHGVREVKYHVVNLIRAVKISGHVANKLLCLGRLQESSNSRCLDPRQTPVLFA